MLKRRDVGEGIIERIDYPNRGRIHTPEGQKVTVKNTIPGQKIRFRVFKKHQDRVEGNLLEVLEASPLESREKACDIFPDCGGCLCQTVPYSEQLALKSDMVRRLLDEVMDDAIYDGIFGSPDEYEYRNKMEFSFGDEILDGPMTLGLHKRATTYTVLDADSCRLVHGDIRKIVKETLAYCKESGLPKYNKKIHEGFLRFLLVRRSQTTGELLVYLITSSQMEYDFTPWAERLRSLSLTGSYAGIFHAIDDKMSDAVKVDSARCLYGKDYFYEELLGMQFKVTAFSFFQTNTLGAEVLYDVVRRYVTGRAPKGGDAVCTTGSPSPCWHVTSNAPEEGESVALAGTFADTSSPVGTNETEGDASVREDAETKPPVLYDLYSGTGTIGQILSPVAGRVYGIELIPEAVQAAQENAERNGLANCHFIAGDVLEKLCEIEERPDYIILDPPREGVNPRALEQIMDYDVREMVYISCKASSFKKDMAALRQKGWRVKRWCLVDLFPQTMHVETVCLLFQHKPDTTIEVDLDISELEVSSAETKATYEEIKSYVLKKFGLKVSNLYIAQVKRECGIVERINYNLPKTEGNRVPQCPEDKRKAIKDAFIHFQMI